VGIGSVDGFGSIIVNDTRWDIDNANVILVDATELKLGMTVRVAGTISADLSRGTATSVVSAAELRGPVTAANSTGTSFEVMGIRVNTDGTTIYEGLGAGNRVSNGAVVQIYGLPSADGQLQATRIERRAGNAASPIVTGAVRQLNTAARTFRLGALAVSYAGAGFSGALSASGLANGQLVRVRATQAPASGVLVAGSVQSWYELGALAEGTRLSLSGLVTDFASQADFRVQGVRVSGAQTNVSGGPTRSLVNGVRVEVSGVVSNGILVLNKLRLRGGPAGDPTPLSYSVSGNISQFESLANFRVQGQSIDASGVGVSFVGGTPAQVARGRRVSVTGSRVVEDLLIAETVRFED